MYRVLVTGASGHLGSAVCRHLRSVDVDVVATDLRIPRSGEKTVLGDLLDEFFVSRVMEGCSAVVHAGNHPNQFVGLSPQRLLSENFAMNANVFRAAADHGVRQVVFASSVQVMLPRDQWMEPARRVPYLPVDGAVPANPGGNVYAQSKEFAERSLRLMAEADPTVRATSLRFPMLVTDEWHRRFSLARRVDADWLDYEECTAHLYLEDAASLVQSVLEMQPRGYRQYFPALMTELVGYPIHEVVRDRYPGTELRTPLSALESLIDVSSLAEDLRWSPTRRLSVEVDRRSSAAARTPAP